MLRVMCNYYPCALVRKGRVVGRVCLFVCVSGHFLPVQEF